MKNILTVATAVAIALNLSGCGENKTVEQYLNSASEYSAKKNLNSAIIELKNAVRLSPRNAEARFQLGKAYLAQGNYVNAEKELEKAQELGIEQSDTTPLLAQIKTKLAKSDEVYLLAKNSSYLNDDDYIVVLTYAGISALANNEEDKAKDYINQAISISETAVYSRLGKAYLSRSKQALSKSLTDIEELLADNPNIGEILLLKGHLLFSLEDYEQAADSFTYYLTQHPLDYSVHYFEINSLIKAELYQRAEVITDLLLAKFKDAPLALHYKAQLQYQKKEFKEAKNNAELSIQAGSTSAITKLIAGASSYQLKNYEQAYNHLKPIESYLPSTHPIKKILAGIKLQLGYDSEAAEAFISLEGLTSDDSAFLQASSAKLIAIGDFDSAQKLIEKAEKLDPNNARLSAQKGYVLLSKNNKAGIDSLERALELDPSLISVELALGIQYLKSGDDKKAQEVSNKLIVKYGNNPSGYLLQGIIFTKENKNEQAIESFEIVLSLDPDNIVGLYNLGLIYQDQQENETAWGYFERVITINPAHKNALSNFVNLAVNTKQLERSHDFLVKLADGDNLTLTIALAMNLRANEQIKESVSLLEEFTNKSVLTPLYWTILGDSYFQLNDFERANIAFTTGLKQTPQHYLLNLRIIGILETLKKYPEAVAQAQKAYQFYPDNDRLEILLTHLEMINRNYAEAKKMLDITKKKQLKHHLLDSVSGSLALKDNNYTQAIDSFSAAYDQKPSDVNLIQLARALTFNGQQKEAEKLLETFIESNPTKINVRLLLAELYSQNDYNKKVQQYTVINNISPNNIAILNNLAWNQYKLGDVENALLNIEHAYSLSPDNIAILETYGVILVTLTKYRKGIEVLEMAMIKGSKDEFALNSLAQARIALNQ